MKPTIGRIVVFNTTESQREKMKISENCNEAKQLPAVIVAVWGEACVNLKVMLDGHMSDIWVTSSNLGDQEGNWNWPVKE